MARRSRSGWRDPREYPDFGVEGMTVPKAARHDAIRRRMEEEDMAEFERAEMERMREEERYFESMGREFLGQRRAELEQERKDKVEMVGRGKAALREAQEQARETQAAMQELVEERRALEVEEMRVSSLRERVELGYVRPEGQVGFDGPDAALDGGEAGANVGRGDEGEGDEEGGGRSKRKRSLVPLSPTQERHHGASSSPPRGGGGRGRGGGGGEGSQRQDDGIDMEAGAALDGILSAEVRDELRYISHLPPPVENPSEHPPAPRPRMPKSSAERVRSRQLSKRAVDAVVGPAIDAYDYSTLGRQVGAHRFDAPGPARATTIHFPSLSRQYPVARA